MESIISSAIDIFRPVMEESIVLAAHYCKESGRSVVTKMDSVYAMRFCGRHMIGKHIGSLYPEIYEGSSSDEDDNEYIVDDSEEVFTRYSGDNELLNKVNECYDTWDTWVPENHAEIMIKNAIDKVE
jgi:hypothetical protein